MRLRSYWHQALPLADAVVITASNYYTPTSRASNRGGITDGDRLLELY